MSVVLPATRVAELAFHIVLVALLAWSSATAAAVAQTKDVKLSSAVAGPLVGQVTSTTAELWMCVDKGDKTQVHYRAKEDDAQEQSADFTPLEKPAADKLPIAPAKVVLDDLSPGTLYEYRVTINGQGEPQRAGSFRTAPRPGRPARFRVGLTSCMKFGQPQKSWELFLRQRPDLHLTVGDTQYSDSTDPNVQWKHHLRYRQLPEFAAVLRCVPTLAMWDDHDYGPNDSDGTAQGKERSLAGWRQVWCNPPSGTAETDGAFFKFQWGDVDFFVVDGRYHRSPNRLPDDEHKRMLGDEQFAWLLNGLKESKAAFKVIASGSTLDHSKGDGWKVFTFSRRRLLNAIGEHDISGVLYMSGDIHRSLVWEHHESQRVGYPLIEVISSGVANSATLSFATIDFDTTQDDPTVQVRIVGGDGQVKDDRTWKLSQLRSGSKREKESGDKPTEASE